MNKEAFTLAIFYLIVLAIFYLIDYRLDKNRFSALKVSCYFFLVDSFVLLWFSIRTESFSQIIFPIIDAKFQSGRLFQQAYMLMLVTMIFVNLGILFATMIFRRKKSYSTFRRIEINIVRGYIVFIFGVLIYLFFIYKVGGLYNVWSNINQRASLTGGLQYFQYLYTICLIFGCCLIYIHKLRDNKKYSAYFFVTLSALILLSLGQRAPLLQLVLTLIVFHHVCISKVSLLNIRMFLLAFLCVSVMLYIVQFRAGDYDVDFLLRFERDLLLRLADIERYMVVIGYFNNHDYWGGAVYESVLYAPIPSAFFPEKPPVDTGVYINAIRDGFEINPPMSVKDLPGSSWPDEYLAGYVSAGIWGLMLIALFSGFVYGLLYAAVGWSRYFIPFLFLFSYFSYFGATPLSPLGIVHVLMSSIITMAIYFYAKLKFN